MRYPASEKAEIIQLVGQQHLPAKRTLDKLGIPRATFYRWYDRYREGGPEALDDRRSRPDRVWNRIPDNVIDLALDLPELSPRELAVRFTDERKYFVSLPSVQTAPACIPRPNWRVRVDWSLYSDNLGFAGAGMNVIVHAFSQAPYR